MVRTIANRTLTDEITSMDNIFFFLRRPYGTILFSHKPPKDIDIILHIVGDHLTEMIVNHFLPSKTPFTMSVISSSVQKHFKVNEAFVKYADNTYLR